MFDVIDADLETKQFIHSLMQAPCLTQEDIVLAGEENKLLHSHLRHTVLRTIISVGGPAFSRHRDRVVKSTPDSLDKIMLHKTKVYPVSALKIDESSTAGNADVITTTLDDGGQPLDSPGSEDIFKIFTGDQLSVSRVRSVETNMAGCDCLAHSFLNIITIPGLFHHKMNATHSHIETHWGSLHDPGSLQSHNTLLDRKPIVLSSLPPFRVCRGLIFVSLSSRFLHCLELVSECEDLDEFGANISYENLVAFADTIVAKFANASVVDKLRRAREENRTQGWLDDALTPPRVTKGDMVFENAVLALRDSLALREFTDAIKAGDSGRVVLILKLWALMYRGSERTKYAHEVLFLVHNLTHVWPEGLRYEVRILFRIRI